MRAIEQALCNLHKVAVWDRALLQKELRDPLMPMVNALVVRRSEASRKALTVRHAIRVCHDSAAAVAHIVVAVDVARIAPTIKISATAVSTAAFCACRPALLKQVLQISESSSHSILRVEHRIK